MPYDLKGKAVEERYAKYFQRLEADRGIIAHACRKYTPTICKQLEKEKTKPLKSGYGILPTIKPDLPYATEDPKQEPERASYSWPRTQEYIRLENAVLDEIEEKSKTLLKLSKSDAAAIVQGMVQENAKLVQAQLLIAEHIHYNWFWQKNAAANQGMSSTVHDVQPPAFLKLRDHTLYMRIYTDIADLNFLRVFQSSVENEWQAGSYKTHLDIRNIARNKRYDPKTHLERFPKDGAILTTGSERSYENRGRAIVLGPEPLTPRELAHKFGHLLGFPDFYQREYKNLGEDGYEITEVVPSYTDIMCEPQRGHVSENHFQALVAALKQ